MPKTRFHRKNKFARLGFTWSEALEVRTLLSAIADPVAYPVTSDPPGNMLSASGLATAPGYSVTQIQAAYGISSVSFNGTAGTGAGQTIAIVAAYDNPNFVDSTDANFVNSDLHKFDVAMGIADPPSFTKVDDTGGTNYPPFDYGWANEIALDVEWTHAIAPQANILLVESPSTNLFGLIEGAGNYARSVPGVSVVTMSFAVSEFSGETQYDQYLTTPAGHAGVTFVAASGDNGDPGGYPGFSPNVLSVGATKLTLSGNTYSSEVGHNTSGGGISQYETKPSYQYNIAQSSSMRTTPDVAFDGNPNTGVSVYDSFNGGASTPWYKIGGTSFSSPAWAGLVAIADQGRATLGLASMDGASQTLPRLYQISSGDYHDVSSGSTDVGTTFVSAQAGYDLVTGRGTPIANLLVPDLAGGNSVSGTVFNDLNSNAVLDSGETGVSGFTVFLNQYNTATVTGADASVVSASDGSYDLSDLPGGTYTFKEITPAGWNLTSSSTFSLTLGFGTTHAANNFGFVTNNEPAKVVFVQQPSATQVTHAISPAITVAVENSSGNIISTDSSSISLALTDASSLNGSLTANAVNGVATFSDVSIASLGTYSLLASDGTLATATSNTFAITSAAPVIPTTLVFGAQPVAASTGTPLSPSLQVYVEDASGHIDSADMSAVTLALAPGSASNAPTGTLTVNAVNGIATFSNVLFNSIGTAALTATDGSLTPVTTSSFPITIQPTHAVFGQQPTASAIGAVITPPITVYLDDASGNIATTDSSAVTLSIQSGTGTLAGTLTVNAVNGVATFRDITVSAAGTFTLAARDALLAPAVSSAFAISVPGTIIPTVVKSTLAPSLIAGSKTRAAVVVSEINSAALASVGTVTTEVLAVGSDGTSTLLGSVSRRQAIKSGKRYLVSVPITTLPASLSGTYQLKAVVLDLAGNPSSAAVPGVLTLAAPFIALKEAFAKLNVPAAVVGGSTSRAAATLRITNSGNIPSTGLTTIGIYASPDGTMANATLVNSITRKLSIRANGSVVVAVPLKLIPAALNGNYTILAEVTDPAHAVTTASSGVVVNIAPPFVQLSATLSAAVPVTVAAGKSILVSLLVHNAGNVDSTGTTTIAPALSTDGVNAIPGFAEQIRALRIPVGKTVTLRLRIAIPPTQTAGTYFPIVTLTQPLGSVTAVSVTPLTVT